MLIKGGVIIKVFLIAPARLVRLRTLSGFAACPGTHASPRAISEYAPDSKCSYVILRSPFARPSLILRSSFA